MCYTLLDRSFYSAYGHFCYIKTHATIGETLQVKHCGFIFTGAPVCVTALSSLK